MASKSAYLRTRLVKHALGIASFTMPTGCYLALYTSNPTVDNTGIEVTGGSYARQAITWAAEANGQVENSAPVEFSVPTATVTHWGILDAATAGNLLYFGAFALPIRVSSGDLFPLAAGNIRISEA